MSELKNQYNNEDEIDLLENPWGEGAKTLEWTLPSPPPYHQFDTLPEVKN